MPDIGPATKRWLLMVATDMYNHLARPGYDAPEGTHERLGITAAAVDELQRDTNPCCCSKSCTRNKPTTLHINPACPVHGVSPKHGDQP